MMDDPDYAHFNARHYLHQRYPGDIFETEANANFPQHWIMPCYHRFYQQFHKEWDTSTAILLDLGGGPCIHCQISAAPFVAKIYHSDYVESCRDEVLMWKNKDPNAYDWSPYFEHVVNTLEGHNDPNAVTKRMEMLRSKIEDVLFCDIRHATIVPEIGAGKVDIVVSNACIENVVKSVGEYEGILQRIKNLLNPKGFFLTMANLGCSFYHIDGKRYPSYPITEENIMESLQKVGFKVHHKELYLKSPDCIKSYKSSNSIGRIFVVAQIY